MKLIKNLSEHKTKLFWIAILYTIVLIFLCLVSSNSLPKVKVATGFDKVVHSIFHFFLTSLWFFYFVAKDIHKRTSKALLKAVVLSIALGIIIEILQDQCTVSRKANLYDVFANLVGSIASVIFITITDNFIKKKSL